ncbi:MAG: transglutaminase domain-containing protein, partial [Candidatus Glassbacteria bacterium]|nr:transglutaminase domain-containing protein [Candidatus Glassbacteria bacterium]
MSLYSKIFLPLAVVACLLAFAAPAPAGGPRVGYEYWIPSAEADSAGMHGIHFKRFVSGSAYLPRYPFSFQRWDDPQLGELSRRLGLDSLTTGAGSEFDSVVRIAHLVSELWAHNWPIDYPVWNALAILDRTGRGDHLWCTYKHLLLLQCLAAIGIQARIVPCNWHHAMEFWSNDYDKWVLMDAWTASYYRRDGVPQGALELHRLSRAFGDLKGSGVWEININPDRWKPERTRDSIPAETGCYSHIRYIPRNDFLSAPLAPKPAGAPGDYLKP